MEFNARTNSQYSDLYVSKYLVEQCYRIVNFIIDISVTLVEGILKFIKYVFYKLIVLRGGRSNCLRDTDKKIRKRLATECSWILSQKSYLIKRII